jgi:hypothetical protein
MRWKGGHRSLAAGALRLELNGRLAENRSDFESLRGLSVRVSLGQPFFLFLAALFAGLINSVAGGGSFLSFPALLVTGVSRSSPMQPTQRHSGREP